MYYVVYGFFYLLSLIPFWFFYLLSDVVSFLLYRVFKYRIDVVMGNLLIAFPEKAEEERKKIAKRFYRNFTDSFIEVIKLISISKKELNKRFTGNYEVVNNLHGEVKQIEVLLGHFFNWEYANLVWGINVNYQILTVYMPLKNKIFNRLFIHIRERFGVKVISATNYRNEFKPWSDKEHFNVLVADQNPGVPGRAYWTDFFGRKTSFVTGPEKSARLSNYGVLVCNIKQVKRGHYNSEMKLVTTNARSLPTGEITKTMVSFLEESIRKNPSNYLWSHKRWKWEFIEELHRKLVI